MPNYPVLRFLEKHGDWVAIILAAIPVLAAIWTTALGYNLLFLLLGAGLAAVIYLMFKSYVELIRVMIDMLLPR